MSHLGLDPSFGLGLPASAGRETLEAPKSNQGGETHGRETFGSAALGGSSAPGRETLAGPRTETSKADGRNVAAAGPGPVAKPSGGQQGSGQPPPPMVVVDQANRNEDEESVEVVTQTIRKEADKIVIPAFPNRAQLAGWRRAIARALVTASAFTDQQEVTGAFLRDLIGIGAGERLEVLMGDRRLPLRNERTYEATAGLRLVPQR